MGLGWRAGRCGHPVVSGPEAPSEDPNADHAGLLPRSRKLEAVGGGASVSGEAEAGVAEVRAQYMGVAEKVAGMLRAQAAGS